jgi:hypothetical protein
MRASDTISTFPLVSQTPLIFSAKSLVHILTCAHIGQRGAQLNGGRPWRKGFLGHWLAIVGVSNKKRAMLSGFKFGSFMVFADFWFMSFICAKRDGFIGTLEVPICKPLGRRHVVELILLLLQLTNLFLLSFHLLALLFCLLLLLRLFGDLIAHLYALLTSWT